MVGHSVAGLLISRLLSFARLRSSVYQRAQALLSVLQHLHETM